MEQYKKYIEQICNIVNKNRHLGVSLISLEEYGEDYWSHDKVYKMLLDYNGKTHTLFPFGEAFESYSAVPWSGDDSYEPAGFDEWENDRKLMLTWCWCIYMTCIKDYQDDPPRIKK